MLRHSSLSHVEQDAYCNYPRLFVSMSHLTMLIIWSHRVGPPNHSSTWTCFLDFNFNFFYNFTYRRHTKFCRGNPGKPIDFGTRNWNILRMVDAKLQHLKIDNFSCSYGTASRHLMLIFWYQIWFLDIIILVSDVRKCVNVRYHKIFFGYQKLFLISPIIFWYRKMPRLSDIRKYFWYCNHFLKSENDTIFW